MFIIIAQEPAFNLLWDVFYFLVIQSVHVRFFKVNDFD